MSESRPFVEGDKVYSVQGSWETSLSGPFVVGKVFKTGNFCLRKDGAQVAGQWRQSGYAVASQGYRSAHLLHDDAPELQVIRAETVRRQLVEHLQAVDTAWREFAEAGLGPQPRPKPRRSKLISEGLYRSCSVVAAPGYTVSCYDAKRGKHASWLAQAPMQAGSRGIHTFRPSYGGYPTLYPTLHEALTACEQHAVTGTWPKARQATWRPHLGPKVGWGPTTGKRAGKPRSLLQRVASVRQQAQRFASGLRHALANLHAGNATGALFSPEVLDAVRAVQAANVQLLGTLEDWPTVRAYAEKVIALRELEAPKNPEMS